MSHQKHTKLTKSTLGFWARHEWAILGTTCGSIQRLAAAVAAALEPELKTGYADADHGAADATEAVASPYALEYIDKINHHRVDFKGVWNDWAARTHFSAQDVVLVNGNHFTANRQIVALDQRKMESLSRKLTRLTRVELLLTNSADPNFLPPQSLPDFLQQHLPYWADIPVLDIQEPVAIAAFIRQQYTAPTVNALILAGGRSTRMGQDKASMLYHGLPQWKHLTNLFQRIDVEQTFISCREDQAATFEGHPVVTDTFTGLGPFGAILSGFRQNPDTAWIVVACDLPLLDESTLQYLLQHRKAMALATCFRQPEAPEGWEAPKGETGFPEPLITIWEPKSYPVLLQFLAQGISCPRKVLLNTEVQLLHAPDPRTLLNVNTPEEREMISPQLSPQSDSPQSDS